MYRMLCIVCCSLMCAVTPALGQGPSYPSKPVVLVVPFALAAEIDTLLRAFAQRYSEAWGSPAVLESKPGANGIIGTEYVTKAVPDGYVLLVSSSSLLMNSLYTRLPYDPEKDLTPISGFIKTSFVLAAGPSLPAGSLKDLIEVARAKPGQLSYATYGIGSNVHLAMEMLQSGTGVKLNHIPYKGAAIAIPDVTAGRVDMIINNASTMVPHIKSGKLRALGVTSSKRSLLYPDVMTFAEAGLPGFEVTGWWGMHAPAGVPRAIVDRVSADTRKILSDPAFRAKYLDPTGFEPLITSSAEFGEFARSDFHKLSKVVRDGNIKVQQ
jgi:tripartite-type tricarboxylate transporter receptor subunit TctC